MIIIHYLNVYYNRLSWKQPKYRRRSYRKCIRKVRIIYKRVNWARNCIIIFIVYGSFDAKCARQWVRNSIWCGYFMWIYFCWFHLYMCMRHMLIDYILLVPYCRQYIFLWIFFFFKFLNCPKIKWIIRWLYVFKKTNF